MAQMPGRATTIQMPRWIQLVGLPVLLVLLYLVAGAVRQVVFRCLGMAASRVDDHFRAAHGQPGRPATAVTL
jgi:hypothetical protein